MKSLTVRSCLSKYLKARHGLIVDHQRAVLAAGQLNKVMGAKIIGFGMFAATGEYVKLRSKEVSSSTIRRELGVLRAALQWAETSGLIKFVPGIDIPKPSSPKLRVLSDAEMKALVRESWNHAGWLRNFVAILLLTGQRKEAVLSLRWDQVDMANRVIHFADAGMTLAERRKGRGTVPINDELLTLFKHLAHNRFGYVIHDGLGNRLTAIYNAWNAMTKAAGLVGVTPHVLRHTVATNLVRNKADIYQVSKLLGHASVQTTERVYVHSDHEPLRKMMDTISTQPQRQETR